MSDTKNKILIASLELFSKYGYNAVSMDMIKDKAQVAKGTLYYFFKNKYGLFQATWQFLFQKIRNYILLRLKKKHIETKNDVINSILYSIDYLWENYENIKMFLISNRGKFQGGEDGLMNNILIENIRLLKKFGFNDQEARIRSIMIIGLIINIFPGKFSGILKNSDKENYKKDVHKLILQLLGGIDEA